MIGISSKFREYVFGFVYFLFFLINYFLGDYEKSSNFAQVTINLINKDLNISDKNQSILDKNLSRLKKSKSLLNNEDDQISSKIVGIHRYELQDKAINSVNSTFADYQRICIYFNRV